MCACLTIYVYTFIFFLISFLCYILKPLCPHTQMYSFFFLCTQLFIFCLSHSHYTLFSTMLFFHSTKWRRSLFLHVFFILLLTQVCGRIKTTTTTESKLIFFCPFIQYMCEESFVLIKISTYTNNELSVEILITKFSIHFQYVQILMRIFQMYGIQDRRGCFKFCFKDQIFEAKLCCLPVTKHCWQTDSK